MVPTGRILCAAAVAAICAAAGSRSASAQVRLPDGRVVEQQQSRVQPISDRTATRGIRRAEEAISAGEFAQAIQYLDGVLAAGEDKFVEVGEEAGFVGLKEQARQLIRDLPPEGRQAYEAAFSAAATRLLNQAIETGDAAALQAVARRYFYTPSGYEASFLLAMDEADAGRHLSAALNYQQLLESAEAAAKFEPHLSLRAAASWLAAGDEVRAREVLQGLLASGRQTVKVAGKQIRLDSPDDSLSWLRETVGDLAIADRPQEQWLTYRGNAARNSESAGGLPHMRVRWKVRLLAHPQLETVFENYVADLTRTGNIAPVASNPIAAGDYIITRTPHGLLAVDFRTGKRVWRSELQNDSQLNLLMRSGGATEEEVANQQPAQFLARRMWEDYLYGLVSSDGVRVYMIQSLPLPVAQDFDMPPWGVSGLSDSPQTNRLSAYELATQGKLVWEIDGAVATGELAGAFFLGAPLHVGESLFILAEIKSGIFLVALDRETGEFQWSQGLADLETGVLLDSHRRLQSAMPSYEAGILVCPTGAGVVIGVDLAKRSLAWAYQYEGSAERHPNFRNRDDGGPARLASRWQDSTATIAGGRVLLTPPDSNELHAIDLQSGRQLWKAPRGDMNRVAFADDQRILLVGNRRLKALRLDNARPAWRQETLALPREVFPSGVGFVSDGKYHLPLTSSEVIAIDIAAGKIVSKASARDGNPLGNLICHRGAVISQNGLHLDCFDQVDELRRQSEERLAEAPNDVEALRTLGEIAYNEGRLSESLLLLERAYRVDASNIEVRDVLAECLATALGEDFVAHRSRLPLLKELSDGGLSRRMLILRIESQGLLAEGDVLASAEACLELYRLADDPEEILELNRDHSATVSRWIQAQLAAVWEQANESQRRVLEGMLQRQADDLGADPQSEDLAHFLRFFRSLAVFESEVGEYASQLDDPLEKQQLRLDLVNARDAKLRRESVAEIAAQLRAAGLESLAANYENEVALKARMEGKTPQTDYASSTASRTQWPIGKVNVAAAPTTGAAANARVRAPLLGIRLELTDAILGLANMHLSGNRGGELVLHDNFGREVFTVNLEPEGNFNYRHPATMYAVSRGNLLLVSLGQQIVAINTLAASDGLTPKVLWRANLGGAMQNNYARGFYAEPVPDMQGRRPGTFRAPRTMDEGKWVGVIGPVTSQSVVIQDQRRLMSVDPFSGNVLWSRTDVPQGCDLFGDDQFVFAVETGKTQAHVYNAIDGRYVGNREVPQWRDQLIARGREILCWKTGGDANELSAYDALTGETLWRHKYELGSAVDIDRGRYVAVVEPKGRVTIIDGADGGVLVNYESNPQPTIEDVYLTAGRDAYLVAVQRPRPGNVSRQVRPLGSTYDSTVIDGEVYLFDREDGRMRWNRPAEIVQQVLMHTQPSDLPFIAFAGQLARHDSGGSRAMTTLLILDKSTGRTLYQSDDLPQTGGGHCVARVINADNHQAAVEMAGQTILLQFTNGRQPPEPPAMAEVESSAGKSSQGLMGIFRNLGVGR